MRLTLPSLAGLSALLLLAACSGGGGGSSSSASTSATSLSYTDPTSGAFRLVKDPASSGGTLVLDLVCTSGTPLSGVSFSFTADPAKATWTSPVTGAGSALNLGSAPQAVVSKLAGGDLQGALSQKGTGSPLTPAATTVLARITLKLKGGAAPGAVTLSDSGKGAYLDAAGVHGTAITVGTLKAQ
ncbi:MAG TPA: hypothetical protein VFM16_03895 [Holophagaceae bacterium]|nr:hypothetical protein [Holophagaceae bacterium]